MKTKPSKQPSRRVVGGEVKCFICFDYKPVSEMTGRRSICKDCNYDPQHGCETAERKFGDYVPVIKKQIPDGMKSCKGCSEVFPESKFITKAGKDSPSCDKCRMAWFKEQKAQGNYF